jgi:YaiO family outer membrane protein
MTRVHNAITIAVATMAALSVPLSSWAQNPQSSAAMSSVTSSSSKDPRFDTLRPDNSFRDWRRAYLEPEALGTNGSVYSSGLDAERSVGRSQELLAGYYRPLSESLTSLVEASYVPNLTGLPEWSVMGQVGAMLGSGWGIQVGLRHSELGLMGVEGRRAEAQLGMFTLEKVWNSYRSTYTVYTSRVESGTATSGHRVALNYQYGVNSSVGLAYGRSWNADTPLALPLSSGAVSSNVGVIGEHWLTRTWSVNYDALFQQDGTQGLRPELRVGLKLAF